jgi:excisionase family DNA binding protein
MPRRLEPPEAPGIGHNQGPSLDDALSMTVKTACKVTEFSRDAIYDLIRDGDIQSFTMGHRRYILVASLHDYLARRAAEPLSIRRGPNTKNTTDGLEVEAQPQRRGKFPTVRTV